LSEVHPHSEHAAEIAEAAGTHHKFWEMHDMLYAHQHALDDQHLAEYVALLRIPTSEAKCALVEHAYVDRVREDFMSGVRSGVNGTPTFFINGLRHDGSYERDELLAAIVQAAR
jgi:protein-disulfide isomerase